MDTKILRNFITIVDCGSISAAAKQLYIAQPALSTQLKNLEKDLNTVLIVRNSHRQKLTDAGQMLYDKAQHILALEQSISKDMRDFMDGSRGTLRLGLTLSISLNMFDGILLDFFREHPNVSYELHEGDSRDMVTKLESGIIDVAVFRSPCYIPESVDAWYIPGERLVAFYNDDYFDFPDNRDYIHLEDLGDKPLVMIRRYESLFLEACSARQWTPNICCSNMQIITSQLWARYGLGVAVVPLSTFPESIDYRLRYKIIDEPSFSTKRIVATMKNSFHSQACTDFLRMVHEHFGDSMHEINSRNREDTL